VGGLNMKKDYNILAIETSCDETAAAIIKNGREITSNVVASQIESHKRFGGVVPEIASRHHVEQITIVLDKALIDAEMTWDDIDAAKAIAFAKGKPLIPVHHIAGHIYANQLKQEFEFPLLALIVSGGHTELIIMKDHDEYEVIGETLDDAAGEAFDKIARVLELPYPGGPRIDQLAKEGNESIDF